MKKTALIAKFLSATTALGLIAGCSGSAPLMSQMAMNRGQVPQFRAQSQPAKQVLNTSTRPTAIPNQVIVKAKTAQGLSPQIAKTGLRIVDSFEIDTPVYLLESASRITASQMDDLNRRPDVEFAQPNYVVSMDAALRQPQFSRASAETRTPNDPLFGQQWAMNKVQALEAWNVTQGNNDLIVSVVDTGIDYNHPDLKGQIIKGKDFTGESADGMDPIDGFGHGTHVAGIINAAANNGIGVAGIAPRVQVMAVKVLNAKGGGSLFAIAGGITYSVKNGAKIINLSLGGPAVQDPISSGVGFWATRKGAMLIAAAGNSAGAVGTPARIDDYYMAVGASDESDNLAKFSCFGKELSVVSPGTKIMATTPTYKVPLNELGYPMNYAALNGTSMATPLVAGLAALVWSKHPDWDYKQVRAHIEKTSVDLGQSGKDDRFGHGRVNALAALK